MYHNYIIQEDLTWIASKFTPDDFDQLKGKRVLITGVNGMIGTYFAFALLKMNDVFHTNMSIVGMVRNVSKAQTRFHEILSRDDFILLQHDVNVTLDEPFDLILHAASSTNPKQFIESPVDTIDSNLFGTKNLLELCRKQPGSQMIFLSTREAYGENHKNLEFVCEEDYGPINSLAIRSCYPLSKKMAENLCISYNLQYKTNCKIARIAHTYGPTMVIGDGRVVGDFIKDTVDQKDIHMNSEGKGVLALTYIRDVIYGLCQLLFISEEVVNISNDSEIITVKQLAELLVSLSSREDAKVTLTPASDSLKAGYLTNIPALLSSDKIRGYGWSPSLSLKDGLSRTIRFFEEMEENYA